MWGMDILGPLPKAPRAVKYLLVAIDYFTKWIEARTLWEITTNKVEKFTWKRLICGYNLPYAIVTNNDTHVKAQTYEDFLTRLGIKHLLTFVEHPQTNGQVEATNKYVLDLTSLRVYGKKSSPSYFGRTTIHPRQQLMKLLIDSYMAQTP